MPARPAPPRRSPARRNDRTAGPVVHCVGDSHASLFSGLPWTTPVWPGFVGAALPGVRSYHLGPYLAHSVATPGHAARRLVSRVARAAGAKDTVLLCFGEIDCRSHVVKQARRSGATIASVARDLAGRYVAAALTLPTRARVAVWEAAPTTDAAVDNRDFPCVGSFEERREATDVFNRTLRSLARREGIAAVGVGRGVTDAAGRQRAECFADGVHLGRRALPLAAGAMRRAGLVRGRLADRLEGAAEALSLLATPAAPPRDPLPPLVLRALADRAALECLQLEARSIALYGAGEHTRRVGLDAFRARGLRVLCIIDDRPAQRRMLGVPVITPDRLPDRLPDAAGAVVLSSDAHEDQLADRAWARFGPRVPIVRMYGV